MSIRITALLLGVATTAPGQVGDPLLRTNHPWYPGEAALAGFERLFRTQAEQYLRATGTSPDSGETKALAAWFFRNIHFAHGEEGREDLWGAGFKNDSFSATREFWTGLFAHGFALCGTTHAQWTAELDTLLGHGRSRVTGTAGHNSMEVFLTGGPYGEGRWVMLDHDLSCVVFDPGGGGLLGLDVIAKDWKKLASREFQPERQRGWLVCGLHPGDAASYAAYRSAEYLAGYAGPPPIVQLRPGESMTRFFEPGLEDGATFVFWGRNYNTRGIPGPERSRTWVFQPEAMAGSETGTAHRDGQMRFANAVYEWSPDFADATGGWEQAEDGVVLGFATPYIIGATPPNDNAWGIYEAGCKNGLVLRGQANCGVSISTDGGGSWEDAGQFEKGLDLTDRVKGHRQYQLKLRASAADLAGKRVRLRTVCQANPATFPHLTSNGCTITFEAGERAVLSAGPNLRQAQPRLVEGEFGGSQVTLELAAPAGCRLLEIHAAAHVGSGNPPRPDIEYHLECSFDDGKTWQSMLTSNHIPRQGVEPEDFWSQSVWWGSRRVPQDENPDKALVRARNSAGRKVMRAEAHAVYHQPGNEAQVTFSWSDNQGRHEMSQRMRHGEQWELPTGADVQTHWVSIESPSK
jgi:hypothetical protein